MFCGPPDQGGHRHEGSCDTGAMSESAAAPHTDVVLLRGVNVNGLTVRSAALRASMLAVDGVRAARTLLA